MKSDVGVRGRRSSEVARGVVGVAAELQLADRHGGALGRRCSPAPGRSPPPAPRAVPSSLGTPRRRRTAACRPPRPSGGHRRWRSASDTSCSLAGFVDAPACGPAQIFFRQFLAVVVGMNADQVQSPLARCQWSWKRSWLSAQFQHDFALGLQSTCDVAFEHEIADPVLSGRTMAMFGLVGVVAHEVGDERRAASGP